MNRANLGLATFSLGAALLIGSGVGAVALRPHPEGNVRIPAGGFYSFDFNIGGFPPFNEISYAVVIESGPVVDVYILTRPDYGRFLAGLPIEDRGSFVHPETWNGAGGTAIYLTGSPYVGPGEFTVVIDNSDFGFTPAGGRDAVVRYRFDGDAPLWIVPGIFAVGLGVVAISIRPLGSRTVNGRNA